MITVRQRFGVSERRACRVLRQPRTTQRCRLRVPDDEPRLVQRMVELAQQTAGESPAANATDFRGRVGCEFLSPSYVLDR